ncbi:MULTISPECIES: hypothetical protein [unclassified Streptomyces]|uniref:hypothetical protein n=1 Tax=unclassified Streptomyces TaxID=2593676 RepID=UPI003321E1D1
MTQHHAALRATLARIHALCAQRQTDPGEVLDVEALSRATGLSIVDVRALLDGQDLADDDIETRVRQRLVTLYKGRVATTGKRAADIRQEIQAHLGVSHEWVRQLCNGAKTPNVAALAGLREYFGVPDRFHFTAPAAKTLDLELQPTLRVLEATSSGLLDRYLGELDALVVDQRGAALTPGEVRVMTTYVLALLHSPPPVVV